MKQSTRIVIVLVVVALVAGVVLVGELIRRRNTVAGLVPGSIPVYVNGQLAGAFTPDDLASLEKVSFVDDEEGKTQEGWLLKDVLLQILPADDLTADTEIIVSSSSRERSVDLTWGEIGDVDNMIMFDLSGRGTLKLASRMPGLATRDEWVQDVDRIDVN